MAENVLRSLLRPLSERRQRGANILDSLDSAATMDRLQGSSVSNASIPDMGDGGEGIMRLASNAGGGSPFRTAQMTSEDRAEPQQTQCQPGMKCYRGPTTVNSYPMQASTVVSQPQIISERVISSRPVVTSTQPSQPPPEPVTSTSLPSLPPQYMPMDDNVEASIQGMVANAANYDTASVAGAHAAGGRMALVNKQLNQDAAVDQHNMQMNLAKLPTAIAAVEATIQETNAATNALNEEAGLTRAQRQFLEGTNTAQSEVLQRDLLNGAISVDDAVSLVIERRARLPTLTVEGEQVKKKTQGFQQAPSSDQTTEGQRRQLTWQFSALQGVGMMLQADSAAYHNTPVATDGTRAPVDRNVIAETYSLRFADGLKSAGMLDLPWRDVSAQMQDDVRRVMLKVNERRYTTGISKEKNPAEYAAAAAKGVQDTDSYYAILEKKALDAWKSHNKVESADAPPAVGVKTPSQVFGYEGAAAPAPYQYQKPASQYEGYTGGSR